LFAVQAIFTETLPWKRAMLKIENQNSVAIEITLWLFLTQNKKSRFRMAKKQAAGRLIFIDNNSPIARFCIE